MRTTVNLDDGLLRTLKARCAAERRTLGGLIEDATRAYLAAEAPDPSVGPPLPVFRGKRGLRPGVDLSMNAGVYEAMYAEDDAETRASLSSQP